MAHDEPHHQDLRWLQIQLFSSLMLKEFWKVMPVGKGSKYFENNLVLFVTRILEKKGLGHREN